MKKQRDRGHTSRRCIHVHDIKPHILTHLIVIAEKLMKYPHSSLSHVSVSIVHCGLGTHIQSIIHCQRAERQDAASISLGYAIAVVKFIYECD